jgi:hypothetical protein
VEAMTTKAKAKPQLDGVTYTPEQLQLIEQFRSDMAATGALVPTYWTIPGPHEIVQAGINAVLNQY